MINGQDIEIFKINTRWLEIPLGPPELSDCQIDIFEFLIGKIQNNCFHMSMTKIPKITLSNDIPNMPSIEDGMRDSHAHPPLLTCLTAKYVFYKFEWFSIIIPRGGYW